MIASQKTYMISGVPFPARNRKAVDSVVRMEPTMATSFLNQRLSKRMMKKPAATAMIIDGNFIAIRLRPKKWRLTFCSSRYGKLIILPSAMKLRFSSLAAMAESISPWLRPPGAMLGKKLSNAKKIITSKT